MLRAIAGLVKPPRGQIARRRRLAGPPEKRLFRKPDERRVGLVFQEYALFPHLTVRQNVAYAGKERAAEYLGNAPHRPFANARGQQRSPVASDSGRPRTTLARGRLDPARQAALRTRRTKAPSACRAPGAAAGARVADDPRHARLRRRRRTRKTRVGVIVDGQLRQFATQANSVTDHRRLRCILHRSQLAPGVVRRLDDDMTRIELDSGELVTRPIGAKGSRSRHVCPGKSRSAASTNKIPPRT